MIPLINLLYIFQILSALVFIRGDDRLVVRSTYGTVMGKWMMSREGKEFAAFLGVPYADPPTGNLRFMPPQKPKPWEGLRNATKEGNFCIQRKVVGEEDCLYLNIFTHNKNSLLPVMVYVHGGGFYGGSSTLDMYGPEYLMDRHIVLVTIQYRLGVFGFLSTEDQVIPGNMGLKDQRRALQWVQETIRAFGGDSTKVTIFGNSAGASSVHLHMISPTSQDLFAQAISQSGTAFSAFATVSKGTSRNIAKHLSKNLNCPTNSSEEILKCLQSINSSTIQQKYSHLQDQSYDITKVLFRPVIEELTEQAFLTLSPSEAFTNKPWLMGINANEGLFKIKLNKLNETIRLIQTQFHNFGPAIIFLEDKKLLPPETVSIHEFYFKNASTRRDMIVSFEHFLSDSWFIWPSVKAIQHHKGILYCYLFNHTGQHSYTQANGGPQGFGVSHTDELQYLFTRRGIFPLNMNTEDTYISKLMINLWTNFAEITNPTPTPISSDPRTVHTNKILWSPSNNTCSNVLHIQTNSLSRICNLFPDRMKLWSHISIT